MTIQFKSACLALAIVMMTSCSARLTDSEMYGVSFCIEKYNTLDNKILVPDDVNMDDDQAVMEFVSKKMNASTDDLGITRFGYYLIVHYASSDMDVVRSYMNSCTINIIDKKMVIVLMART